MAVLTPLFMDISAAYSGDEMGLPHRDMFNEGILASGDLLVTAPASGMSVNIAAGAAYVAGDTNPAAQPTYRVRNDATVNVGISADPSLARKVLVVLQITDETFAGTGRNGALVAIHGTPAASPIEPALPLSALPLALVDVPAADTDITAGQITDRRVLYSVKGSGASTLVATLPASPSDGQIAYYQDATLAGLGIVWTFRYRAAAGTHKWEGIGEQAGIGINDDSDVQTASATAVEIGTNTRVTPPLAGVYRVRMGFAGGYSTTASGLLHAELWQAGALLTSCNIFGATPQTAQYGTGAFKTLTKTLAASEVHMRHLSSAGTGHWTHRTYELSPIKVA